MVLGSVRGALIAAVIVGLVRSISEPVLISAGGALGRQSYNEFGEAIPYMFLIAVLMIMPKGIGHALNEWQIERAKNKNEWRFVSNIPSHVNNLLNSIYLPHIDYFSEKIKGVDSSQKGTLATLGSVQIIIVSILDIYTSGQGIAYYLIDFIYLILQLVGLSMVYFSLSYYQTEIKFQIVDLYFQIVDSSLDTKRKLLGSGFLIFAFAWFIDYLVAGVGILYLALDYVFLFTQLFGLLMILYSSFFLYGHFRNIGIWQFLTQISYRINLVFVYCIFTLEV